MKRILFLLPMLFCLGCGKGGANKENDQTMAERETVGDFIPMVKEALPTEPSTDFTSNPISILLPVRHSGESYDPSHEKLTWTGLYIAEDSSISCKTTAILVEAIHDEMNDEEGEKSGRKVSCPEAEISPMVLIAGIENLDGKDLKRHTAMKSHLWPGESMQLGAYTITATGTGNAGRPEMIQDYKLIATGTKNGSPVEQVLVESAFFDDAMVTFHWVGDIDGDGIADLYMDTSHKYSYSNPALFCSARADEGAWLKLVSEYSLFGC